jgi:Transposase DDE domain group 1
MLSEALDGARGHGAHEIKAVNIDRRSDRTAATTFLAHALRLLRAWAAYVLHHALRTSTFHHTARAQAQPSTLILTLCKIAAQVKPSKDRLLLHLPSACPVPALLHRVTALLYAVPLPVGNTS